MALTREQLDKAIAFTRDTFGRTGLASCVANDREAMATVLEAAEKYRDTLPKEPRYLLNAAGDVREVGEKQLGGELIRLLAKGGVVNVLMRQEIAS